MNDQQWEQFYDLLSMLMKAGGTWAEKRDAALEAAKQHDMEAYLEEFVSWFKP